MNVRTILLSIGPLLCAATAVASSALPQTSSRVLWRFQVQSPSVRHRPGVASDGSVHFIDGGGILYALNPGGTLKWTYDTGGSGLEGPVAVGGDDTLYVMSDQLGLGIRVHAVAPDGTERWTFDTGPTQETISGPAVGPDGNVYAVVENIGGPGIGAFSLSPRGQLRWDHGTYIDFSQVTGTELAFTGDVLHFDAGGILEALDLDGNSQWVQDVGFVSEQVAAGPGGDVYVEAWVTGAGIRLRSFDTDGGLNWTVFGAGTNSISAPTVGPDGTLFIVRNGIHIHAIRANGTSLWTTTDDDYFGPTTAGASPYAGPVVDPTGARILLGGSETIGAPGVIEAFDAATGASVWEITLPLENGANLRPATRPLYAPDGQTAYLGVSVSSGEGAFLYALDTREPATHSGGLGTATAPR